MGKPKPKGKGRVFEDRAAKALGARKQPGSGNQVGKKGDLEFAQAESFVAECKETEGKTLALEMHWLRKIDKEARDHRKKPMFLFSFKNMDIPCPKDWAAIPLPLMKKLIVAAGWEAML